MARVEVGYATLIRGEGALQRGQGPVRTGVTGILPRGRAHATTPVFAATFALNGNGELTGSQWIEESGFSRMPEAEPPWTTPVIRMPLWLFVLRPSERRCALDSSCWVNIPRSSESRDSAAQTAGPHKDNRSA